MRAAVLGSPIDHSKSPVLHRAAYAALGLPWQYDAIDVPAGQLAQFKASLDAQWRGLSLTMPLKEEVLDLLDDCSERALRTRSANTVVIDGGRWLGSNTDISGMVRALQEKGAAGRSASIIGAGATARSAVAAAADLGVERVRIWARRPEAAVALIPLAESFGLSAQMVADADLSADVVFSTVPANAAPDGVGAGYLLDAIYAPWPPPLTRRWDASRCATGLDLLLWQAVAQVEAMTGSAPPVDVMRNALWSAMGLPQSGK